MRSVGGPEAIESALAKLGSGALTEAGVGEHVAPLFSRVLERRARVIGLGERSVIVDARGPWLRLCPDVLTTEDELRRPVDHLAAVSRHLS